MRKWIGLLTVCVVIPVASGCDGSGPPPPEIQKQNFDDELKAAENAKEAAKVKPSRPKGP